MKNSSFGNCFFIENMDENNKIMIVFWKNLCNDDKKGFG